MYVQETYLQTPSVAKCTNIGYLVALFDKKPVLLKQYYLACLFTLFSNYVIQVALTMLTLDT